MIYIHRIQRAIALSFVGALTLFSPSFAHADELAAESAQKKITLAFITNNPSDYWVAVRRGVDAAVNNLPDVKMTFKIPANGTATEQQAILDDLTKNSIDGIVLCPVDPEHQTNMINLAASKSFLITADSDAPNSNRRCYVGANNVDAGFQAGEQIKMALPHGGKIAVFVGTVESANARDRIFGIRQSLQGSNIQILKILTDNTDRLRAQQNVRNVLMQHPDIQGCIGIWSYNGPAIGRVVERMHLTGKVKIVAFDDEQGTIVGIESHTIYSAVVPQAYEMGKRSLEILAALVRGNASAVPTNKHVYIPMVIVNAANVRKHVLQQQAYLKDGG